MILALPQMALYRSPHHGQVSPNSTSSLVVGSNLLHQSLTYPLQLPWQYTTTTQHGQHLLHTLQPHQEESRSPTSNIIIPTLPSFLPSQGEGDADNATKKPNPGKCYSCPFCRYITCRKSDYSKHIRVHTGERPYQCLHCQYSASDASNLRAHEKKVHPLRIQQHPSDQGENDHQEGALHSAL